MITIECEWFAEGYIVNGYLIFNVIVGIGNIWSVAIDDRWSIAIIENVTIKSVWLFEVLPLNNCYYFQGYNW